MKARETIFGPDYEPYLRNLKKKWGGQKLLLGVSASFFLSFVVLAFLYQTMIIFTMLGLAALMTLGTFFIVNGYRLLNFPKDHFIKKKIKTKRDVDKLVRTDLRKWADKNKLLYRREAGFHYYYFWYAYAYSPIYFVMRIDENEKNVKSYYLWPRQFIVASPGHPNITSPASPYRVRERELERDKKVFKQLMIILGT